jgi:serine/threonine protein kinase
MFCLFWFELVDSQGEPYKGTSASKVSLPSAADVDDFRDAVKAKLTNKLSFVDADDLLVYANKAAFDAGNLLNASFPLELSGECTLGNSEEAALIVIVPALSTDASRLSNASVTDKLQRLGVAFRIRDINYLTNNDTAKYALLKAPDVTPDEARKLLAYATSKVHSTTQRAIGLQHSFFLDGSLNVGQGQIKSSLYYAFSESGGVFVAKVYNGHKDDFTREVDASQALEHKNLVKFIKTFSIQDDMRHVIIMPFFPRSLADWLTQHSGVPPPLTAIRAFARNCFDALCHVHSKGLCFADLKPANIMLQNSEPGYATLVDYGGTVRIGSRLIEYTTDYCLDADQITATERLDWICLGTTLAQCVGVPFHNCPRAVDLANTVSGSSIDDFFNKLILSCLLSPSASSIERALNHR